MCILWYYSCNNVALTNFGCWSRLQRDAKSDNGAKQEFWLETKFIPESFFFCYKKPIYPEKLSVSQAFFFLRTKSLSVIYCPEMNTCMFIVWYVPMHLCVVVLVWGSLVTENVWNKVFTIKSTRTESYYNTCTLKYLYSICLIYRRRTSRRIRHMP